MRNSGSCRAHHELLDDPGDQFVAGQVDRALRRLQIHIEELTDVRQDAAVIAAVEAGRAVSPQPVRVRKARRSGTRPACRRRVLVGDLIASIGGAPFMCIGHLTREHTDARADELAEPAALMTKPPTPGRVGQDHDTTTGRTAP